MIADVQTKLAPCGSLSQLKQPARCTALRSLRCKETSELRHRPSAWHDARIVLSAHCFLALSRLWICDPQGTPGYTSTLCTVPWEQSKVGWPFSRLQGRKSSTPLAKASSWFAISCYWIMRDQWRSWENLPIIPFHPILLGCRSQVCAAQLPAQLRCMPGDISPRLLQSLRQWPAGWMDFWMCQQQRNSPRIILYIMIILFIYIIIYIYYYIYIFNYIYILLYIYYIIYILYYIYIYIILYIYIIIYIYMWTD
jgi:hypothetical protein